MLISGRNWGAERSQSWAQVVRACGEVSDEGGRIGQGAQRRDLTCLGGSLEIFRKAVAELNVEGWRTQAEEDFLVERTLLRVEAKKLPFTGSALIYMDLLVPHCNLH